MFKDTKEGTTHYYGDGCGEPMHNTKLDLIKQIEEIPDKEPDYESNDYDLGLKDMKDEIIKIIELELK